MATPTPKVKLTGGDINTVMDASKTFAEIFPPVHGELPSGQQARDKFQSLSPTEYHALIRSFAAIHRLARKLRDVEFKTV